MDSTVMPLIIIGLVVIAVVFIFLYLRNQKLKNELRERGVTTARVMERHHNIQLDVDTSDNNFDTHTDSYAISYPYSVNGTTCSGRDDADQNMFEILREGQPVEVIYLPENPAQARLASSL